MDAAIFGPFAVWIVFSIMGRNLATSLREMARFYSWEGSYV
jgi:hypothetical protein